MGSEMCIRDRLRHHRPPSKSAQQRVREQHTQEFQRWVSGCVVREAFSSRARFICTTVVQIGVACTRSSGTVVPALKTLIFTQLPALKTYFPRARCPADIQLSWGGSIFPPQGPQNHCCGTLAELHRERSAAADELLRAGMERFLPSASGSSAAGLKPCGEPTCKFKSQLVTTV